MYGIHGDNGDPKLKGRLAAVAAECLKELESAVEAVADAAGSLIGIEQQGLVADYTVIRLRDAFETRQTLKAGMH